MRGLITGVGVGAACLLVAGCATDSRYAEFSEILRDTEYMPLDDVARYVAAEASSVPEQAVAVPPSGSSKPDVIEPVVAAIPAREVQAPVTTPPVRVSVPSTPSASPVPAVKPMVSVSRSPVVTELSPTEVVARTPKDTPEPPAAGLPVPA
ncbi:MAG: hypothetical protein N2255_07150, partial [Kiritimatiellae bacterium]|nr:hypothetical protein [Kiritimatiellia bacterium]